MYRVETEFNGRRLTLETGLLAKQSDGAVLARYGDTVVLATVVAAKKQSEGIDFIPLTIDYQEKAYSAGKIPGGFFKREGKPSEKEILTSRLIDRPLRPLIPKGFFYETQGIVSVLSYGDENISDVLGIIAMSSAMMVSDIPFNGPVGAVRVGILDGKLVANPGLMESERLDLNLVVAATDDAIVMVEGGGNEISEEQLLKALQFAHEEIKKTIHVQHEIRNIAGKKKGEIIENSFDMELISNIERYAMNKIKECIRIPGKQQRQSALDMLLEETINVINPERDKIREISMIFNELEKKFVRSMILNEEIRADGRKPDEIRPIYCMVGILPKTHGSALFVRGETQALSAVTLGTHEDEQKIESLEGETFKSFMLHYNFPPFSVGEVKPLRSPGRREIGHGALAERGLKPVIPPKEVFPYTIRVVSDILESNGSSSMATVCAGTLAMMDAGIPIKKPVAGIAMGLIKEGDRYVILTDILGLEDHLGDMDFKVTGTEDGITAFQMDVKVGGISEEIMREALEKAKIGRLYILEKMREVMQEPRKELAPHAPRIYTIQIKPEKIRDVIGTGGKIIRGIIDQTGVKIDIEDNGVINIASNDEASAKKAIDIIKGIVEEPEVGKIYLGKVKRIVDFGAFVEILPGTEGLLHISEIAHKRISKVTDVLKEGDEVLVKILEIDKLGRIKLSRKSALSEDKTSYQKR